jgi:hypothetical protein
LGAEKRKADEMLQRVGAGPLPVELKAHAAKMHKNEVNGINRWKKVQTARAEVVSDSVVLAAILVNICNQQRA